MAATVSAGSSPKLQALQQAVQQDPVGPAIPWPATWDAFGVTQQQTTVSQTFPPTSGVASPRAAWGAFEASPRTVRAASNPNAGLVPAWGAFGVTQQETCTSQASMSNGGLEATTAWGGFGASQQQDHMPQVPPTNKGSERSPGNSPFANVPALIAVPGSAASTAAATLGPPQMYSESSSVPPVKGAAPAAPPPAVAFAVPWPEAWDPSAALRSASPAPAGAATRSRSPTPAMDPTATWPPQAGLNSWDAFTQQPQR